MRRLVGLTLVAAVLAVPTISFAASDDFDRDEQFLHELADDIRWRMLRKKVPAPRPAMAPVAPAPVLAPPTMPTFTSPCPSGTIPGPPAAVGSPVMSSMPSASVPGPVQLSPAPRLQVLYSRDGTPRYQVLVPKRPTPVWDAAKAPPPPPPPPAPVTVPQVTCIPDPMANVMPDPVSTGTDAILAGLNPVDGTTDAVDYLPGSNFDGGTLPAAGAPVQEVPEPGSLALLGAGLAALGLARRRRRA